MPKTELEAGVAGSIVQTHCMGRRIARRTKCVGSVEILEYITTMLYVAVNSRKHCPIGVSTAPVVVTLQTLHHRSSGVVVPVGLMPLEIRPNLATRKAKEAYTMVMAE
jgi:hypothetical protein